MFERAVCFWTRVFVSVFERAFYLLLNARVFVEHALSFVCCERAFLLLLSNARLFC